VLGSSPELVSRYNKLDREITLSIKAAIKRVIKKKQFGYFRSAALIKAGKSISYWKAALSAKRNDIPTNDDDDGLTSRWDFDLPSSIAKTIADAQMGAQIWTDLLEGTGQSIAFHKSMWQLLGFDPATFPPRIVDQAPHSITLKDRMGGH